jgi:hypothetical protein
VSRVGRLAGALLAETDGSYYLVGNLKRPCDFPAAGFEKPPGEIDAITAPYLRLARSGPLVVPGPWLTLAVEGEDLPRLLAARLLVERNGSVSDRLWRMILSDDPDQELAGSDQVDARWLGEVPAHVWRVVRETVLRCV